MERQETIDKLNFMASWLENMHVTHPQLTFNYAMLVAGDAITNAGGHACGTVGCAVGNMPHMWPNEASLACEPGDWSLDSTSSYFLNIDGNEWERLFQPGGLPEESGLPGTASAVEVAAHIRRCASAIGAGRGITSDEFREKLAKLDGYKFVEVVEDED